MRGTASATHFGTTGFNYPLSPMQYTMGSYASGGGGGLGGRTLGSSGRTMFSDTTVTRTGSKELNINSSASTGSNFGTSMGGITDKATTHFLGKLRDIVDHFRVCFVFFSLFPIVYAGYIERRFRRKHI